MKKLSEIRITQFQNMTAKQGVSILLFDELKNIKTGKYKDLILKCRAALAANNKELYVVLKSKLPAVTFCAEFANVRKASELTIYNNLMILDIDNLSSNELIDIKTILSNDKYILSFWDSPSGNGLKGLIKINSNYEKHKAIFNSLKNYFIDNYEIELDVSGKDISRLCFSSWDENIFFNSNAEVYVDFLEENKKKSSKKSEGLIKSISLLKSAYATEGLNKVEDRNTIRQIIKYLTKRNLSITETHDDWLKVSFAIASAFSYDVGEKYFLSLCRLDQVKHNEEKSINLLKSSYNNRKLDIDNAITFATIIFFAKNKGFKI
ncbi:BT4734/BF3469 family protein [Flavobacterium sp.]|uniref:BT4734/BF3469 family protein n=1 Tax=Flavobacterium sp. TaxID=239 RepID=UPI0037511E59